MKFFIGADGGGTKTAFVAADENGVTLAAVQKSGCSYHELGIEGAVKVISEGITELLSLAGLSAEGCAGCCLGMPCFGESTKGDAELSKALKAALPEFELFIVNDAEVGHAGALNAGSGIYIVAGTGSIAFAKTQDGRSGRCGGWPEFYGDEGSCHWIGREAMSLFTKQADGRLPKGALYETVACELCLKDDKDFIDLSLTEIIPYRSRVAEFQRYACTAAENGDKGAAALFITAAAELSLLAKALKDKLFAQDSKITVSYGGGLFKARELITKPLNSMLANIGCILQPPKHSAVKGALMLAQKTGGKNYVFN